MNCKFHHTHLICRDLNKAIRFFEDTLGAKCIGICKFGQADGAKIELSGSRIFLRKKADNEIISEDCSPLRYGIDHLAFEVDDVDTFYKDTLEKGCCFLSPPKSTPKSRIVFLRGPDNITIELISAL